MNSKIESILNHEGIFSIVAKDEDFPHIVNTWNTFVIFKDNNPYEYISHQWELGNLSNLTIINSRIWQ